MVERKSKAFGYFCIIATIFFFSTYEVVNKSIFDRVDPLFVNFLRFFVGGLLILPFALREQRKKNVSLTGRDIFNLALVGGLNVALSMGLLQMGIFYGNASLSALLFSCNPLFVMLFAYPILGEELDGRKIVGLILSMIGILIVFWPGIMAARGGDTTGIPLKGFVLPTLAAIVYGIYTVLGKKYASSLGSIIMNAYSFIFGSIILFPFVLLLKGTSALHIDPTVIPQLIYISVFVSGLAYILYFTGLSIVGASLGSMVFFIKPVLAGILAALLLGEHISINHILGGIFILGGLAISNVQWRRERRWSGSSSKHQQS
jgi:drug/metabolite transporter (DMT)-like permease